MRSSNVVKVKPVVGPSVFYMNRELEIGWSNVKQSRNSETVSKVFEKKGCSKRDTTKQEIQSQIMLFQRATRWLIILGQSVGLMPVIGVLLKPPSVMKFKVLSFRFLYSSLLFLSQTAISIIALLTMFNMSLSVKSIGFVSFYLSSSITTILFIQVATKWPKLIRELPNYKLEEYVDPKVIVKCNAAMTIFLLLAIVEHILAQIAGLSTVLNCSNNYENLYRKFIEHSFPWVAELSLPGSVYIGIVTQFVNVTATLTWNYSDLFIVCISFYLISILEGINKKISGSKKTDYSRAAQLIRAFDDVISGIVFTSFATNLFFICLQLYNLLSDGVHQKVYSKDCPWFTSGPLGGYENVVYFTYSMVFVLFRYLSVSLIAARVHTSSQSVAPALYAVPSTAYNTEVQRFLDQVHHDTVALSGLKFFYVTKSLVLTVAGTIFTYELVLLQYGG